LILAHPGRGVARVCLKMTRKSAEVGVIVVVKIILSDDVLA